MKIGFAEEIEDLDVIVVNGVEASGNCACL